MLVRSTVREYTLSSIVAQAEVQISRSVANVNPFAFVRTVSGDETGPGYDHEDLTRRISLRSHWIMHEVGHFATRLGLPLFSEVTFRWKLFCVSKSCVGDNSVSGFNFRARIISIGIKGVLFFRLLSESFQTFKLFETAFVRGNWIFGRLKMGSLYRGLYIRRWFTLGTNVSFFCA